MSEERESFIFEARAQAAWPAHGAADSLVLRGALGQVLAEGPL